VLFHPFIVATMLKIRKAISLGEVDAVLFSAMPSAVIAPLLGKHARRAGVPLLAIAHGHDVILDNAVYRRMLKSVFANLDGVLAVSRSTGAASIARGLDESALYISPNGVDPDRFGNRGAALSFDRKERRALLQRTFPKLAGKIPPGALVLCSVGRQVKRKGQEWFVRSVMPRLESEVHLVLGGRGPEAEAIGRAATESGMVARVHALGLVPEEKLAGLYCGSDLFVMPNIPVSGDMEGFGVVMLEAGLCGLPSIAARVEGIEDVIAEGVNGYAVAALDAAGFAERINLHAKDRAALDALSRSARAHTLNTYSWDVVAANIVETIRGVIGRAQAKPVQ
jgi:phosphatidylinositol alpha-1,6-mannosyltransferase